MFNLPEELNRLIVSYLCKYCNNLKYLNKKYYLTYNNPLNEKFLKQKDNYKLIFKTILDSSFYKKCFSCYFLNYKTIEFLCKNLHILNMYKINCVGKSSFEFRNLISFINF